MEWSVNGGVVACHYIDKGPAVNDCASNRLAGLSLIGGGRCGRLPRHATVKTQRNGTGLPYCTGTSKNTRKHGCRKTREGRGVL